MSEFEALLATIGPMAAGVGAAIVLRRAWSARDRERPDLRALGWGIIALTLVAAAWSIGSILGIAFAAMAIPIGALLIVGRGATRRVSRAARPDQVAPEPLQGPSKAWRGWLKVLLAGPLGMLAAMGISFCYAAWAPGAVQTRLLIAALLVPGLWGLAMTWTLADQRLLRSTAVLSGTVVVGFGLAFLGGLA